MKKLFGTDGMRGVANRFPLDEKTAHTVGRALAMHLKQTLDRTPRIIIGRDTRESGAWLESALVTGAETIGAECLSAGVITTPGVAFLTQRVPADAGVVISASHNPYEDNGIKIFTPSGRKLPDTVERFIEKEIYKIDDDTTATANDETQTRDDSPADGGARTKESTLQSEQLRGAYLDYLIDEVARGLRLQGLSIVVDCANGAATDFAPKLFGRLGAEVHEINCAPNGKNINKNCGSLHLEGLVGAVHERNAALGVAFDGDADRALFVNSRGEIVDGDATLWILAKQFAARGALIKDAVVATVMSNIGLELAMKERGWNLHRTDVGDKYVLEELLRIGASVGGEQSGHIILPHESLVGDGMRTAIHVLQAMRETAQSLDELTNGFVRYPQVLVNVRVREKLPFDQVPRIAASAREIEDQLGANGRLLLRYSGTEPLARVMIEGKDDREINRLAAALAEVIRQEIGE